MRHDELHSRALVKSAFHILFDKEDSSSFVFSTEEDEILHIEWVTEGNHQPCLVHMIHKLAFDDLMIYETV